MAGQRWTEQENMKLRELYPTTPAKELAIIIKRSAKAIGKQASSLGLQTTRRGRGSLWTEKEIYSLGELFPINSAKEIAKILGRPFLAINKKARELNLQKKSITFNLTNFQKGAISMAIDTDGSLGFYKIRCSANSSGFTWHPVLQFTNNDEKLVEYFRSCIGFGTISKVKLNAKFWKWKDAYHWCSTRTSHILGLLKEITLVRKEKQRQLVMEACDLLKEHRAFYTLNNNRLEEIYQEIRTLNKRGK